MNTFRKTTLTLLATAALAACSSMPDTNARLEQARSDYATAQADAQTRTLAAAELKQAGDSLAQANAAFERREDTAQVDQLAYLARQRIALAQEAGNRKGAEAAVAEAAAARDRLRLEARTREADNATRQAGMATQQAANADRNARASQQQANASQMQADAATRRADASQQQAGDAERRNMALEQQMRDLNARQTARGMVITLGDVLFDTGRAQLRSGGTEGVQKLGAFLKQYPGRKVQIEGYTDSVGGETMNLALSERRANAVMDALVDMGVARAQVTTRGFGEANPVAGNDNAAGRQQNRRVEIVLSDEGGTFSMK